MILPPLVFPAPPLEVDDEAVDAFEGAVEAAQQVDVGRAQVVISGLKFFEEMLTRSSWVRIPRMHFFFFIFNMAYSRKVFRFLVCVRINKICIFMKEKTFIFNLS